MGSFSEKLRQLRFEKGLTQYEMAKAIGVAKSTISQYETGNREPDFKTLENIADFFNVNVDYLLGRTNKTAANPDSIDIPNVTTIAAHFEGDEFTEAELEEIKQFAEFVKNRRK